MADDHRAGLGATASADLAERGADFVDEQIDGVSGTFRPESAEAPEKRLAGEGGIGAERNGATGIASTTLSMFGSNRAMRPPSAPWAIPVACSATGLKPSRHIGCPSLSIQRPRKSLLNR